MFMESEKFKQERQDMKVQLESKGLDAKSIEILEKMVLEAGSLEGVSYSKIPFVIESGKKGEITISKQHGIMVSFQFFPHEDKKDDYPGFGLIELDENERITEEELESVKNSAHMGN